MTKAIASKPSFVGLFKLTERSKVYVLQNIKTRMYVCEHKTKKGGWYFGLFIGKAGKRYGAARFDGGPELNAKLELPDNADLIAVEVAA